MNNRWRTISAISALVVAVIYATTPKPIWAPPPHCTPRWPHPARGRGHEDRFAITGVHAPLTASTSGLFPVDSCSVTLYY